MRIQLANIDSDAGPSYDSAFLTKVQKPSTSYVNSLFAKDNQEQKYPKQPKIINDTIGDDQINSNIIFDEPNVDVNSGSVEYDNNVQASYELEQLARNAYKEAEKQQINASKVKQQNKVLTQLLELYKEKADNKSRRLEKDLQTQFIRDQDIIRASENLSNARTLSSPSETKPSVASMPSSNPMNLCLEKMENEFTTLFALLQTNSKRESIFYTTPEEIRLTKFCQQEVKPILHELHLNFEIFQKRFSKDIKEMKDVFDSTESDLSATWKQNELLNDQLLEAKLKHQIKRCVLLSHECVNNNVQDEIEKIQRDSIEIQEGMQKRINILENDVQICQKQSLDFELQIQHEKLRRKCESSLKTVCETSWISKMEKLENENVSLEFKHVNQKTYAYAKVRAENQDLLMTISKLKTKLKNVEQGLKTAPSVRRPLNRDSSFKNSVLSNTKKSSAKLEVSARTNKNTYVASKNVVSNKKIITDVDVKTLLKRRMYCVFLVLKITARSTFKDTTPVVLKSRFSVKTTQSKSLDTTPVVFKTKIAAVTPLSAKNKIPSAFKSITIVVQIVIWIVDSGCSKHMTSDRLLLESFVEKFMGTVRFRTDHFAAITGNGDYVQGNITVCNVYYVEGLGHNLFSAGQFCNGARESNLYTISISDMAASSPVYLSLQNMLWHRRLSHLNFGNINDLTKHYLIDGLLKFKYSKDHLCSACERGKSKKSSYQPKLVPSTHSKLELLHMDLCGPMRVETVNGKKYILAKAISTACFTQNRSTIHTWYNKTPYELLHGRKPNVEYFYVFGSLCYPTNDRDDLGKMKPKADIGIFIGYSETSRGFRIYNGQTKKIMETIHVKFDKLTTMASEHDTLEPISQ
ncbi:retrovirus-related pol polyprotein from transposon TNT 1-94 [Tanacetum coccineum]